MLEDLEEFQEQIGNVSDIELNANPTKKEPSPFTLYVSNVFQYVKNKNYKNQQIITNKNDLSKAVSYDHIFSKMENNSREKGSKWIESDALFADVDNDFTENESEWITPEKFNNEFNEYEFYLVASRNNNKEKIDDKGRVSKARPKYHIYFPIGKTINNETDYQKYLIKLNSYKHYFDPSVKDVSRLFFAVNVKAENHYIIYHSGKSILSLLDMPKKTSQNEAKKVAVKDIENEVKSKGKIKNGERHKTLLDLAYNYFSKNGLTDSEENDIQNCRNYLLKMNETIFENPLGEERIGENKEGGEFYSIAKYKRDKYREFIEKQNKETKTIAKKMLDEGWIKARKGDGFSMYNINHNVYWNLDAFKSEKGKNITNILKNRKIEGYPVYELSFRPDKNKGFFVNENGMNCYNTFQGFNIEAQEGDCTLVLNHLKEVWADDDEVLYDYIIKWFAHSIQKPGEKIGTALAMNGQEGSGKGCIMRLMKIIYGNHFYTTSNNKIVNGGFNAEISNKLFVFFDEIGWTEKDCEGILKQWITEEYITEEQKGVDRRQIKSFHNFIFTTNNIRIMNLSKTDRRYVIFKTSNKHCGNYSHFAPFFDKEKSKKLASTFMFYLLNNVNINNWNPAIIPNTEERKIQIDLSKNIVEMWLEEYTPFERENIPFPTINERWKKRSDVLGCFEADTHSKLRPALFWKHFRDLFLFEEKIVRGYKYISLIRNVNQNEDNAIVEKQGVGVMKGDDVLYRKNQGSKEREYSSKNTGGIKQLHPTTPPSPQQAQPLTIKTEEEKDMNTEKRNYTKPYYDKTFQSDNHSEANTNTESTYTQEEADTFIAMYMEGRIPVYQNIKE